MEGQTHWRRPASEPEANRAILHFEAKRDYENAALAAVAAAYHTSNVDLSTHYERLAQVYATLEQSRMARWLAENRQPAVMFP